MRALITTLLLGTFHFLYAQKPPIDGRAISEWPSIERPKITDDGNYVSYTIKSAISNVYIRSTKGNKLIRKISGIRSVEFFGDAYYFFKTKDTLWIHSLKRNFSKYFLNVASYKKENSDSWLILKFIGDDQKLVILNTELESVYAVRNTEDYFLNKQGNALVVKSINKIGNRLETILMWIDLRLSPIFNVREIYRESNPLSNISYNVKGNAVAFISTSKKSNSVWVYRSTVDSCKKVISDGELPGQKIVEGSIQFSDNDKWIYFLVSDKRSNVVQTAGYSGVDIWSYKDIEIQTAQLNKPNGSEERHLCAFNIDAKRLVDLESNDDVVCNKSDDGNYVILRSNNSIKYPWLELYPKRSYYLFSLLDNSRRWLKNEDYSMPRFSPESKFVMWFDRHTGQYFSLELATAQLRNISKSIKSDLSNNFEVTNRPEVGVGAWLKNDEFVIVYDNYDVWKIDPRCKRAPINVTNGLGKKENVRLRLVYENEEFKKGIIRAKADSIILLVGFNGINKYNGFYAANLNKGTTPNLLCMGPYTFYRKSSQKQHFYSFGDDFKPVKAVASQTWLLTRQSEVEFPNLFLTHDFKTFSRLTDLEPQKPYNWLTTELFSWRQPNGGFLQGILYKPENFDPSKKYPLIFNFYESVSHRLYEFPKPEYAQDNINIPWLVSRDFLVFTPDIQITLAKRSKTTNGENALITINSALKQLLKYSWIDSSRIGIQGHSFGGGITNYLVTHIKSFSAAISAAGASDITSSYLRLTGPLSKPDNIVMDFAENGQGRMGGNLWELQQLYLKNSPILFADKVKTPLLIMHNRADGAVPWMQGVEMFLALYRLQKKVWMLQYDNGQHSVFGEDAVDFTIRMQQFFDHYLKSAPAPTWMTQGIPARLKGVITGYDLDPYGNCGKDCLVCKMWNVKMKKDSVATMIEIREKEKMEHWVGNGISNK